MTINTRLHADNLVELVQSETNGWQHTVALQVVRSTIDRTPENRHIGYTMHKQQIQVQVSSIDQPESELAFTKKTSLCMGLSR